MRVCGTTKIQSRSLHGIPLFRQSPLVEMKGWTSARKLRKGRSAHKIHLFVEWKTAATNLRVSTGLHHASSINSLQENDLENGSEVLHKICGVGGMVSPLQKCNVRSARKSRLFDICLIISMWSVWPYNSRRRTKNYRSSHVPNGSSIWLRHTQFARHHATILSKTRTISDSSWALSPLGAC